VLVHIVAAGLHSDLSVMNADQPRPLPMALGHEAAGIAPTACASPDECRPTATAPRKSRTTADQTVGRSNSSTPRAATGPKSRLAVPPSGKSADAASSPYSFSSKNEVLRQPVEPTPQTKRFRSLPLRYERPAEVEKLGRARERPELGLHYDRASGRPCLKALRPCTGTMKALVAIIGSFPSAKLRARSRRCRRRPS
jgi:hypothetical protein